jgi:hypothetical protein
MQTETPDEEEGAKRALSECSVSFSFLNVKFLVHFRLKKGQSARGAEQTNEQARGRDGETEIERDSRERERQANEDARAKKRRGQSSGSEQADKQTDRQT